MVRSLPYLLLVVALTAVACTSTDPAAEGDAAPSDSAEPSEEEPPVEDASETAAPHEPESGDEDAVGDEEPLPDPGEVGANELGMVPVLMFHRLLEGGGGEYDLDPGQFRAILERLHAEDYRPVRLKDVVRGEIDIAPGTSPVVLTFDDSPRDQAHLDDGGELASDTSLGMLVDFAAEHEGFEAVASVYVNEDPFGGGGDSAEIMRRLHDLGFELGNHTARHTRLDQLDAQGVRRELAEGRAVVTDAVPDAEVVTVSLPLGFWPDPRELVYEGEIDGLEYAHEGILLVGADPAPSPYAREFDPMAIPRIRSSPDRAEEPDYMSEFWLDWLQDNPERRYVSDGDPSRVSFPAELEDELAPAFEDVANPY